MTLRMYIRCTTNSRVRIDPDLNPRGPDPFLSQLDPESVSMCPGIRVTLTRIPGQTDPDTGLAPWDPESGSILTRIPGAPQCSSMVQYILRSVVYAKGFHFKK